MKNVSSALSHSKASRLRYLNVRNASVVWSTHSALGNNERTSVHKQRDGDLEDLAVLENNPQTSPLHLRL